MRKLVKFFENSRDGWKAKCQEAKYKVKMLQNKVRYLEKRKAELNKRVKELEEELQQHREKKTVTNNAIEAKFNQKPAFHKYSVGHITLFISFVLSGCTSLRGASRVIDSMLSFLELGQPVPSWYSGRLWLLRLGYYKLHRETGVRR